MPVKRSTGRSGDPDGDAPAHYQLILIGTSWGGLGALRTVVAGLPADFPIPVAVVQHRHRDSDALLARILQSHTGLWVSEIEDKQPIEAGRVFIAPANYHLLVERGFFSLSLDAPVRHSRPSIDLAMISAADAYTHHGVGLVLTDANDDGAAGLRRMADRGALAVVQDPATAEIPVMPQAALRAVPTARVFTLERLPAFLRELAAMPPSEPALPDVTGSP
jgi:two-component system, chemotaxis family, protein-glutamate methylesterase/glutaminase